MENPALLLPDNDPMDLTHLRQTGMARVGQQYGAVGPVPIFPNKTSRFLPREGADTTQYIRPRPSCRLSPPSPAILGNPAPLKQDPAKESRVLISSYTQRQNNPMVNPKAVLETTVEDHGGFPLMLWKAVCVLLGRPARPRYVAYENSL